MQLNQKLCLLTQAFALAANTPVQITASACQPWHYTIHIAGTDTALDQECDLERLSHAVTDAVESSGFRKRLEDSFVERIIEEYVLARQASVEGNETMPQITASSS